MATAEIPAPGTVTCDNCGEVHPAEYSHDGDHGQGPIFVVYCTKDDLADYYQESRVIRPEPAPVAPVEGQTELLLLPDTTPTDDRKAEIAAIVNEEYTAQYAEVDRHRRTGYGQCACGWEPKRPNGAHANVATGVHVKMARTKAEKTCQANIDQRMADTRRPIN